ncbi:TPM domain-containing protein [Anthocerotibacter panamensis]|uniref:TPM domain-containing protein n=1 Tax=Anthocerotibacter panamensis TaxID=2857077 RepID=UPI001C40317F|nr:TPM domain-containing protein [Anthocerotibacter panamensis]
MKSLLLTFLMLCLGWSVHAEVPLPSPVRPVVDLVGTLDAQTRNLLTTDIGRLEHETGWKVRVLVQQNDRPGSKVKPYWGLNERSVVILMDLTEKNPLRFNAGAEVQKKLPRFFWRELQARYGNQYYIADHGRGAALVATFGAIGTSLREGGRATVPGLSYDHWLLTFISSILGGLVAGFACHPRRAGEFWHWQGLLFAAPLWSILFVLFGLGVVLVRTLELLPVLQNCGGFAAAALVAFLIPTPKREKNVEF